MSSSLLVRLFGFPATLVHGDTLVLDRWRWLTQRLPVAGDGETLLDVGCGTGAFTIGTARRGYRATGISWDERNQTTAAERAKTCGATTASFVIGDVRELESLGSLDSEYDVALCLECIEHVLDDLKLMRNIAARLKPGGRLFLTTPNYNFHPITSSDKGPFQKTELGWHVRRGYTPAMLAELCEKSGLMVEETSYCSGFVSQKATYLWRRVARLPGGSAVRWLVTLPLRLLPLVLPDRVLSRVIGWPFFSICLEAYKPRFPDESRRIAAATPHR